MFVTTNLLTSSDELSRPPAALSAYSDYKTMSRGPLRLQKNMSKRYDKRHILDDDITTLAYGHKDIPVLVNADT